MVRSIFIFGLNLCMQCLPLTQKWHLAFRNYPDDPAMGGDAKCVTVGQTGPLENDTVPIFFSYSPNVTR